MSYHVIQKRLICNVLNLLKYLSMSLLLLFLVLVVFFLLFSSCCNCCRAASWCEAGAIFSHEQKQMCAIYIYQSLRISRTSPFSPIHRIVWKQETSPKPTKPSSQSTTFRWIFLRYFIQNHKSIDPLDDPPSTRPTP